jgi:CheY-like chemotaxis protein
MMEDGKKKILIVDDDVDSVKMVGTILEDTGYVVISAGTGEEALRQIEDDGIDLIILDVVMPDMDGYSFFQALKADVSRKDVPVIVVTGKPDMKELFQMEGVSVVIDKPFETKLLLKKIEESLARPGRI